MKNLFYILLLSFSVPLMGVAQNDTVSSHINEKNSPKNQIDLDFEYIPLELDVTYKRVITDKWSIGIGSGIGTSLIIITQKGEGKPWSRSFMEIFKFKIYLDHQISDKVNLYLGLKYSVFTDTYDSGSFYGLEMGVFYTIWRFKIGVKPSLGIFNDGVKDSFVIGSSLLVIKIPIKKW
jgi:hypothetical protein